MQTITWNIKIVDNNSAMDNAETSGIFSDLAEYNNFQRFFYLFKLK